MNNNDPASLGLEEVPQQDAASLGLEEVPRQDHQSLGLEEVHRPSPDELTSLGLEEVKPAAPAPAAPAAPWAPPSKDFNFDHLNTKLSDDEEAMFHDWKEKYAPNDSGKDYDLRGAFRAGLAPDPETGHWADTFKKPNHPTFSDQSQYAEQHPNLAGKWEGDTYLPNPKRDLAAQAEQENQHKANVDKLAHALIAHNESTILGDESAIMSGIRGSTISKLARDAGISADDIEVQNRAAELRHEQRGLLGKSFEGMGAMIGDLPLFGLMSRAGMPLPAQFALLSLSKKLLDLKSNNIFEGVANEALQNNTTVDEVKNRRIGKWLADTGVDTAFSAIGGKLWGAKDPIKLLEKMPFVGDAIKQLGDGVSGKLIEAVQSLVGKGAIQATMLTPAQKVVQGAMHNPEQLGTLAFWQQLGKEIPGEFVETTATFLPFEASGVAHQMRAFNTYRKEVEKSVFAPDSGVSAAKQTLLKNAQTPGDWMAVAKEIDAASKMKPQQIKNVQQALQDALNDHKDTPVVPGAKIDTQPATPQRDLSEAAQDVLRRHAEAAAALAAQAEHDPSDGVVNGPRSAADLANSDALARAAAGQPISDPIPPKIPAPAQSGATTDDAGRSTSDQRPAPDAAKVAVGIEHQVSPELKAVLDAGVPHGTSVAPEQQAEIDRVFGQGTTPAEAAVAHQTGASADLVRAAFEQENAVHGEGNKAGTTPLTPDQIYDAIKAELADKPKAYAQEVREGIATRPVAGSGVKDAPTPVLGEKPPETAPSAAGGGKERAPAKVKSPKFSKGETGKLEREGYKAAQMGASADDNPHDWGSDEHAAWADGFDLHKGDAPLLAPLRRKNALPSEGEPNHENAHDLSTPGSAGWQKDIFPARKDGWQRKLDALAGEPAGGGSGAGSVAGGGWKLDDAAMVSQRLEAANRYAGQHGYDVIATRDAGASFIDHEAKTIVLRTVDADDANESTAHELTHLMHELGDKRVLALEAQVDHRSPAVKRYIAEIDARMPAVLENMWREAQDRAGVTGKSRLSDMDRLRVLKAFNGIVAEEMAAMRVSENPRANGAFKSETEAEKKASSVRREMRERGVYADAKADAPLLAPLRRRSVADAGKGADGLAYAGTGAYRDPEQRQQVETQVQGRVDAARSSYHEHIENEQAGSGTTVPSDRDAWRSGDVFASRRQRKIRQAVDTLTGDSQAQHSGLWNVEGFRSTPEGRKLIGLGLARGFQDVVFMRGGKANAAAFFHGGTAFLHIEKASANYARYLDHEAAHLDYRDQDSTLREIGALVDVHSPAAERFREGYEADTGLRLDDAMLREEVAVEVASGRMTISGDHYLDMLTDAEQAAKIAERYYAEKSSGKNTSSEKNHSGVNFAKGQSFSQDPVKVNPAALTKETLARMSKILKREGFDLRGADDVRGGLYGRTREVNGEQVKLPPMLKDGVLRHPEWAAAYREATEGVAAREQRLAQKQDAQAEHPHVNRQRIRELGYTNDLAEAGYITPEGGLIDLSGKREGGQPGTRSYDHREAGGTAGMQEFIAEGNIRIDKGGMIDIGAAPTPQQLKMIERIARDRDGEVVIDFSHGLGKYSEDNGYYSRGIEPKEFPEGTTPRRILNEVRGYYGMPKFARDNSGEQHEPASEQWIKNAPTLQKRWRRDLAASDGERPEDQGRGGSFRPARDFVNTRMVEKAHQFFRRFGITYIPVTERGTGSFEDGRVAVVFHGDGYQSAIENTLHEATHVAERARLPVVRDQLALIPADSTYPEALRAQYERESPEALDEYRAAAIDKLGLNGKRITPQDEVRIHGEILNGRRGEAVAFYNSGQDHLESIFSDPAKARALRSEFARTVTGEDAPSFAKSDYGTAPASRPGLSVPDFDATMKRENVSRELARLNRVGEISATGEGETLQWARDAENGGRKLAASNATITAPPEDYRYMVQAYHGTPHTMEPEPGHPLGRFRKEKVGTGEGAAAYGWGVAYIAESKGVAADYQRQLSGGVETLFDGKPVDEKTEKMARKSARLIDSNQSVDGAIKYLRYMIENKTIGFADDPKGTRDLLAYIESNKQRFTTPMKGNLYHVEVDAEPHEMLDWDKPLSEQSEHVRKALAPLVAKFRENASRLRGTAWDTGQESEFDPEREKGMGYYHLANPDNPQAASEYLASLGIKGIRYADAMSRGDKRWTVKSPQGGENEFPSKEQAEAFLKRNPESTLVTPNDTYNYVVFNEKDIRVVGRNGETLKPSDAMPRFYRGATGAIRAVTLGGKTHFFLDRYHDDASGTALEHLAGDIREEALHRVESIVAPQTPAIGKLAYGGQWEGIAREIEQNYKYKNGTPGFFHELAAKAYRDGLTDAPVWRRFLDAVVSSVKAYGRRFGIALKVSDAELRNHVNGVIRDTLARQDLEQSVDQASSVAGFSRYNNSAARKAIDREINYVRDTGDRNEIEAWKAVQPAGADVAGRCHDLVSRYAQAAEKRGIALVLVEKATFGGAQSRDGRTLFINGERPSISEIESTIHHELFHAAFDAGDKEAVAMVRSVKVQTESFRSFLEDFARSPLDMHNATQYALDQLGLDHEHEADPSALNYHRIGFVKNELVADFIGGRKDLSASFIDAGSASRMAQRFIDGLRAGETLKPSDALGGGRAARDSVPDMTTPDGTRANLFQRIEAVPLDTERKYTFKDDDVAKAEKALAAVVAGRQAALSDPHAAQDDGGNAYSDMMEDGEWSDKTDAERRAIINEDYDRFENDAREEVRKEKEARDYIAAREKTGAQLNRADHQLTILLAGLDGVEVKRQHSGQGSDYIYVSDEAGDNSVTLRVSNHRQVQGGGFRVNDMGDGRAGNADVDIVGDEVGTSIFIREGKSWSYNEKPATWQELAEYLSDNLGDVKLRDDIRFARREKPDQTETPEFKRWFGASKVVDAEGKPLVMYHGTSADFDAFDMGKAGANFGVEHERGAFFTNNAIYREFHTSDGKGGAIPHIQHDIGSAGAYAENSERSSGGADNVMPVFLSLKNPLVIEEDSDGAGVHSLFEDANGIRKDILRAVQAGSHDGIIIRDLGYKLRNGEPETIAIAFAPTQIKSATGNRGTFDPANADIRFARAPTPGAVQAPGTTPAQKREPVVMRAFRSMKDMFALTMLPNAERAGVQDGMVHHAVAPEAAQHQVRSLLATVFKGMKETEIEHTMKVLNADNILGGLDDYREMAWRADVDGDTKKRDHYTALADAIDARPDLGALQGLVYNADRTTQDAIGRWKATVNPYLESMWKDLKGIDPNTPEQERGHRFGARVNLLGEKGAEELREFIGGAGEKPMPTSSSLSYRNPNVKRDKYDQHATFTGKYSNDPFLVLSSVVLPRYKEWTKQKLYEGLIDKGAAVVLRKGDEMPADIQGQPAERFTWEMPSTGTDPSTGEPRMGKVTVQLAVRKDLVGELRQVLNTDMRLSGNPIMKALTQLQLLQMTDAVTHSKNMMSTVSRAQGAGVFADLARKGVGPAAVIDTMVRITKTYFESVSKNPDTAARYQAEVAELARIGAIRPDFPASGVNKVTHMQQFLHHVDTACRVIMSRFYSNLVKRGLMPDTESGRRTFINQIGVYNSRLMSPLQRTLRDSGFAPFVVAGRNYNRQGRYAVTGYYGAPAATLAAGAYMRAVNLAGTAITMGLMPIMLNMALSGSPFGRAGTPVGAVDLGGDEDEKGKFKTWDFAQLSGIRRGFRMLGLNALASGLKNGQDVNHILGQAIKDNLRSLAHPWSGPGIAFLARIGFGAQVDVRGEYSPHKIEEGGAMQTLENFRAAIENQNPLIYSTVSPLFKALTEAEGGSDDPGWLKGIGMTLLKSPSNAVGVRDSDRVE